MIEFVAPLTYLVCFSMAYYSPNSNLIGNVANGYWHYNEVKDLFQTLKPIFVFFLVDLSSALLCQFLLWLFCRINLFKACMALQKEFGFHFGLRLVSAVTPVRIQKICFPIFIFIILLFNIIL